MTTAFTPLPNKASALVDAISVGSRAARRYPSQHVRAPRQRPAWTGSAVGALACVAVAGLWLLV
jgi:hypothetical protein